MASGFQYIVGAGDVAIGVRRSRIAGAPCLGACAFRTGCASRPGALCRRRSREVPPQAAHSSEQQPRIGGHHGRGLGFRHGGRAAYHYCCHWGWAREGAGRRFVRSFISGNCRGASAASHMLQAFGRRYAACLLPAGPLLQQPRWELVPEPHGGRQCHRAARQSGDAQ